MIVEVTKLKTAEVSSFLDTSRYPLSTVYRSLSTVYGSLSTVYESHQALKCLQACTKRAGSDPEVIKSFSCSTQVSMKFSLLMNMKMPTIFGIFIFISREIFMLSSAILSKKECAIVGNLRFISGTSFMLCWVKHEKSFITSGSDHPAHVLSKPLLSIHTFCGIEWFCLLADTEGPDQPAQMRRLIWAFAVRICPKTCSRMAGSILWVNMGVHITQTSYSYGFNVVFLLDCRFFTQIIFQLCHHAFFLNFEYIYLYLICYQ